MGQKSYPPGGAEFTADMEAFDDLHGGAPPALNEIAEIADTWWAGCRHHPTSHIGRCATHEESWELHAISESGSHVQVEIRNIMFHMAGFACDMTVNGTAHGAYDDGDRPSFRHEGMSTP